MFIFPRDRAAGAHESITVSNTAIGFSLAYVEPKTGLYKGQTAKSVFCSIDATDNNIRFCIDGTTATTTVGHQLIAGQNLTLNCEGDIKNFSVIRDDAADATLHVTYRY